MPRRRRRSGLTQVRSVALPAEVSESPQQSPELISPLMPSVGFWKSFDNGSIFSFLDGVLVKGEIITNRRRKRRRRLVFPRVVQEVPVSGPSESDNGSISCSRIWSIVKNLVGDSLIGDSQVLQRDENLERRCDRGSKFKSQATRN
ncbi:hypothetical protein U1Q18_048887 [Sarracenia purpurea var. burkii]